MSFIYYGFNILKRDKEKGRNKNEKKERREGRRCKKKTMIRKDVKSEILRLFYIVFTYLKYLNFYFINYTPTHTA